MKKVEGMRKSRKGMGWLLFVAGLMLAHQALAQGGTTPVAGSAGILNGLKTIIDILNGGVVRGIAVLGVAGLGIAGLLGRIDWMKALQVVLAIGVIFASGTIADAFIGAGSKIGAAP